MKFSYARPVDGRIIILLLVSFVTSAANGQTLRHPIREPRVVFNCRSSSTNIGGDAGALTLDKSFFEDGSVYRQSVTWEDYLGSFVYRKNPTDRAMATLKWPGDHRLPSPDTKFDWSLGSIAMTVLNNSVFQGKSDERWRQLFVDRNGAEHVYQDKFDRYLQTSDMDLALRGDLIPQSTHGLLMSLDSLLAWSAGVKTVTVYETFVTPRLYKSNEYPNSPAGARRIVAEYDVSGSALARKVVQIREFADHWMNGLGDFKAKCTKAKEEFDDDIVVN